MIIENLKPFEGLHCETTATGTLLKHIGIDLSEPLLFGLGEGLGFIFWNMKLMDFPFIGGRIKTDLLTQNIAKNLNLKLESSETSSIKKAWEAARQGIDSGLPVGLKLDCYHLEYFPVKIHFAGHYVALYGYDENYAYLIDTQAQGCRVKTSLKSLELARNEKGAMSSRNLSYTIRSTNEKYILEKAILHAIKRNANDFLNPPINNIGFKGILKTGKEIKKWLENSKDIKRDFKTTAMLMEKGGTGGALFRNLYKDFLMESYELVRIDNIKEAQEMFCDIAKQWTEVSRLFDQTGETKNRRYIDEISEILIDISGKEKSAMEILMEIDES